MEVSARRAQTRQKLLDAAVTVFARTGVLAATVEEICEQAGFTRGAFYSNFSSKDELVLAHLEQQAAFQRDAARRAVESVRDLGRGSAEEMIARGLSLFMSTQPLERDAVLADQDLRLYAVRVASVRKAYLRAHEDIHQLFADLIIPVIEANGYRLTMAVPVAMDLLQGAYEQSLVFSLIRRERADPADTERVLGRLLQAMIEPL